MRLKLALLIANGVYDDTTLSQLVTPEVDVDALAMVLRDPEIGGFDEVETLKNEPTRTIMMAIARFFNGKKREDLLLLYFSGHGVLDIRGRLYLAGKDTDHNFLDVTAIPSAFINERMDDSRSKQKVLILDCCYSGAFTRGTKGGAGKSVNTATRFNGQGRVIFTATDATQYAWEGDRVVGEAQNSVFTRYLVQGLKTGEADGDADGWITLDEWYNYVYDKVAYETSKQTPSKWVEQQGSIVIAKSLRSIKQSIQLTPPSADTLRKYTIANAYNPSVVRIFARDTVPVGVGFLVSQRYLVTCAHTVAQALDIPYDTLEMPTDQVSLDFPLIARGLVLTAQVIYWLPTRPEYSNEIAVLELKTALPEPAYAGHFVIVDDLWGHSWQAFGFPRGYDEGLWATGTVKGKVANNWIQIEGLAEPGYSGSPVWSSQASGIVGMVVAWATKSNMGFMIPLSDLVKVWPELGQYVVQGEKP